jgi:hypothetical protein
MVVNRRASTSNPAGSPTVRAESRQEGRTTQRTSTGLEIPVPNRRDFEEDLLDTASRKRPQQETSEPD